MMMCDICQIIHRYDFVHALRFGTMAFDLGGSEGYRYSLNILISITKNRCMINHRYYYFV